MFNPSLFCLWCSGDERTWRLDRWCVPCLSSFPVSLKNSHCSLEMSLKCSASLMNFGCLELKMESQVKSCEDSHYIVCDISVDIFSFFLPSGQFPSTFVEPVTIPSTKTGENLYVCINDFNSVDLPLKRGTYIMLLVIRHAWLIQVH